MQFNPEKKVNDIHQEAKRVSVIIPTLNAEKEIEELLFRLERQSVAPVEILIIDSGSTDGTIGIVEKHPFARMIVIPAGTFNHGRTRDLAAREASGDLFLFMTQDALPTDEYLIQRLAEKLAEPGVAAAYARQVPKGDATPREKCVRAFSYPAEEDVHDLDAVKRLGLRAFYLSNACAAYNKEIYFSLGGFEQDLRSNEDMLFAAKAIRRGYRIIYAAEAEVFHSHGLSLREQYERNKLQGYELARHRELLINDSPASAGGAMVKQVTRNLWKEGHIGSWVAFLMDCGARWFGNRAGRREYMRTQNG